MAKQNKNIEGFVNPFTEGIKYSDFLNAIPEGVSVEDYCKGNLTEDEITWIKTEIENYKNNNKN